MYVVRILWLMSPMHLGHCHLIKVWPLVIKGIRKKEEKKQDVLVKHVSDPRWVNGQGQKAAKVDVI